MNLRTVKAELYAIAKAYPTLLGLMRKQLPTGETTVGEHWAGLLADLDPTHFSNVCDEYATLERQLPDPIDRLPAEIKWEVKERTARDHDRRRHHERLIEYKQIKTQRKNGVNRIGELQQPDQ